MTATYTRWMPILVIRFGITMLKDLFGLLRRWLMVWSLAQPIPEGRLESYSPWTPRRVCFSGNSKRGSADLPRRQ